MKRILIILLCVLISAFAFAGCGAGNPDQPAGATQAVASDTTAQASSEAATTAPAEKQKATLDMVMASSPNNDKYENFVKQFAEKKNYDLTFNLTTPAVDQFSQTMRAKLAAKEDIDIFSAHAQMDLPVYNRAGYLEDLSAQPFVAKLLDVPKQAVSIDGKVLAAPLESLTWGGMYNKKIFSDLGLKPPTTLTELKTVVEKLKANNITPFLLSYKDSWIPQLLFSYFCGTLSNTKDKDFVSKMNAGTGTVGEFAEMFDVMDYVNANGSAKMMELGGEAACAEFANGKAAMWFMGDWYADSVIKANPDFQLGDFALPLSDDPKQTSFNQSVSTSFVLSKEAKNKEVALDFLNYLYDDEDSSKFFSDLALAPVTKTQTIELKPWQQEAQEVVKSGHVCMDVDIPSAVKDTSGKLLQSYFTKAKTRDQVIKELDKAWADAVAAAAATTAN